MVTTAEGAARAAIHTEGLTKYYGKERGIEDVNLDVQEGEVFGFLGPNGAGKSTTIRTLLDEIRPTSGAAAILGLDTHRDVVAIRRHGRLHTGGPGPLPKPHGPGHADVLREPARGSRLDVRRRAGRSSQLRSIEEGRRPFDGQPAEDRRYTSVHESAGSADHGRANFWPRPGWCKASFRRCCARSRTKDARSSSPATPCPRCSASLTGSASSATALLSQWSRLRTCG